MKKLIPLICIFLLLNISLFAKTNELFLLPKDSSLLEERITKLIKKSDTNIKIAMYNFSYKKIAKALKKAVKRGVEITVLLDSSKVSKNDKIYKYLNKNGINTIVSKKKLHTKLILFDKKYVLLGSINLTKDSFKENYESVLLTKDKEVIQKVDDFISSFK